MRSSNEHERRDYVRSQSVRQVVLVIVLFAIAFIGLGPYIFMFITAFKTNEQFYHSYWNIPWPLSLNNYGLAWHQISGYFMNSVIVAAVSIFGVLLFSTISSFVMARYNFPAKTMIYWMVIALLAVPGVTTLIPLFILIKNLGLVDTRWSLILPYIAGGQVMGIFLMRTFFENLPTEIFEAATIDGATGFVMFRSLTLPLSKPIIMTVAMIQLINVWNDYVWPSVTISSNALRTITIGLAFFQGQFITQWGQLFAGYVIASIPLLALFIFGMRYFVSGLTGGVVK